ncbi:MAG TPA: hypothetical protein VLC46_03465 [Thermoanaerobaculia bacterium]|jgi:hypothetical protein|nr:hypothetical protein [Thermoanaerobaculia bacterium]
MDTYRFLRGSACLLSLLLIGSAVASGQTRKSSHPDQHRADAIASLRAVRSALDAGANLEDFKKYQIESRIKVDALPESTKNRDIREVSDIYTVALRFGTIHISGAISTADVDAARRVGADSTDISAAIGRLTTGINDDSMSGRGPLATEELRYELQTNRLQTGVISQLLILSAERKLSKLK